MRPGASKNNRVLLLLRMDTLLTSTSAKMRNTRALAHQTMKPRTFHASARPMPNTTRAATRHQSTFARRLPQLICRCQNETIAAERSMWHWTEPERAQRSPLRKLASTLVAHRVLLLNWFRARDGFSAGGRRRIQSEGAHDHQNRVWVSQLRSRGASEPRAMRHALTRHIASFSFESIPSRLAHERRDALAPKRERKARSTDRNGRLGSQTVAR